jgi:hypothetical protein
MELTYPVTDNKPRKRKAVYIDPEIHRSLKLMAAERGTTLEDFAEVVIYIGMDHIWKSKLDKRGRAVAKMAYAPLKALMKEAEKLSE